MNEIQHKNTLRYAGCRDYLNVMLNVIMLIVLATPYVIQKQAYRGQL
jgi:hypothetical protein